MNMKASSRELLSLSLERYSQADVARKLNVTAKTVRGWEVREDGPPEYRVSQLQQLLFSVDPSTPKSADFTFIDLFAGIGGIRKGFEKHGGRCVFTSEWDKYAVNTYCENFTVDHPIAGDITKVAVDDIPDHDLLLAGFPCQPFSIAGVSKKNSLGRKHGFQDKTQGTLFFDVARIIQAKRPKAFLLENVKNLMSHDKGKTFQVIKETLEQELGYRVFPRVVDGKGFVPQHRERIYLVGYVDDTDFSWDAFRQQAPDRMCIGDILHPNDGSEDAEHENFSRYITGRKGKVLDKYILSDKLWNYLYEYAAKHKAKGNGFGYGMVTKKSVARTLSARYYKDGSEILVSRGPGNPRRLTPRECARLMGYDKPGEASFKIPVSDTQSYKQFGNSVVVPVIEEIARIMKPHILSLKDEEDVHVHQYSMSLNA